MKISLFNKFGALNSAPVFAAFQQGLDRLKLNYDYHNTSADVAVIWSLIWTGRMKNNQSIWQEFRNSNRPVIVLEVGMLDRGRTWKVGINGTGNGCYSKNLLDYNRPRELKINLLPWQNHGDHILIAAQGTNSQQWAGKPPAEKWLEDIVKDIRKYSERPIKIRPHPRQSITIPPGCSVSRPIKIANTYDNYNFYDDLNNAWAVVNYNSSPGSQSIIAGVPAFVDSSSLAAPVANLDLSQIENPLKPDRSQWIVELCHTEWTLDEIATGKPLERLLVGLG